MLGDTTCKHDIFIEWCHLCKYEGKDSVKSMILEENLKIVETILSWPMKTTRTI